MLKKETTMDYKDFDINDTVEFLIQDQKFEGEVINKMTHSAVLRMKDKLPLVISLDRILRKVPTNEVKN